MSDHIELSGIVESATKGIFFVRIDNTPDHVVKARISGRMRKNKIKVINNDRVIVKVSPYDLSNGFIIKRL